MRAYHEAIGAPKKARASGTMQALLDAYQKSPEWARLAPRTKRDYAGAIAKIEAEYARHPIEVLEDPKIRPRFLAWRDKMAEASARQADAVFGVLRIVLEWARDRGLLRHNHATRPKKVYRADRSEHLWLPPHIVALRAAASPSILLAFELGLSTGQRKVDLLKLGWSSYDGTRLRFRQGKRKRLVDMPVTKSLKALLDAEPRRTATILSHNGKPWTVSDKGQAVNFDHHWRSTVVAAGLNGLHFHDLRGTTCTALAEAGATPSEIAAMLGWTVTTVNRMLDTYQAMTAALSDSAVAKLEARAAQAVPQIAEKTAETRCG
ncbi:tyrosine-type recombinase/integrase [Sphingomonas gellani]|nr:tyrosine-type recombinase/integrase [Sphingomonas gellani]